MAKFYGMIGFSETYESSPGIWTEKIIEHPYYGDIIRNYRRNQSSDKINDDVNLTNDFSIIADDFAFHNYPNMKYVTYMGIKWTVISIENIYPRLRITVGGIHNG